MTTKKRNCGCCGEHGHFKPKCPNRERVQKEKERKKQEKIALKKKKTEEKEKEKERKKQEKIALKKKKAEEKEKKRIEKEIRKKLAVPRAGTGVKGRDGSTRHGYIISYSKYNGPLITEYDIDNRNDILKIDQKRCFWCNTMFGGGVKKCGDHLHPCCVTTRSCYAWTNALSIVPSCDSCNSRKGKKSPAEWAKELPSLDWTDDKIKILLTWIEDNSKKLLLQKSDVEFVEKQFPYINEFHKALEDCAKTKTDIGGRITINDSTTLAFGKGANLKQKKLTSYFK